MLFQVMAASSMLSSDGNVGPRPSPRRPDHVGLHAQSGDIMSAIWGSFPGRGQNCNVF